MAEDVSRPEVDPTLCDVLIVDDSATERARLTAILKGLGYGVTTAENGQDALNLLKQSLYPIVITDQMMPIMNGLELCRAIRTDSSFEQPYIIMLTAAKRSEDLVSGMEAGADDFLEKPANRDELRVRLQAGVRTIKMRSEIEAQNVELNSLRPEVDPTLCDVLIVDDSATERARLTAILTGLGYAVTTAENGQDALNVLKQSLYPIVITDQMMPIMNGCELCRAVRTENSFGQPYIIMLTAAERSDDLVSGMEAGADDFLRKPANRDELRVRLQAGVRTIKMRSEIEAQNVELNSLVSALTAAQSKIDQELSFAARLQQEYIPDPQWLSPTTQLATHFATTHGIGGDSMGIVQPKPGQTLLYQIDVMGHGIASAMLSFTLQNALQQMLNTYISLGTLPPLHQFVRILNERFPSEKFSGLYCTLVIALLDEERSELRYCQAGHPQPCVVTTEGEVMQISRGSFPVGLFDFADYETRTLPLPPGSTLMISTDGLFDTFNGKNESLGRARVETLLALNHDKNADQIMESIVTIYEDWCENAPLVDDVSVMIVKRTSTGEKLGSFKNQSLKMSILPEPEQITQFIQSIEINLQLNRVEELLVGRISASLAELLNNLAKHRLGLEHIADAAPIDIHLRHADDGIEVLITEYSPPVPHICPPRPIDPLAESGKGLHIMQAWIDQISIERINNSNCWRLSYKI